MKKRLFVLASAIQLVIALTSCQTTSTTTTPTAPDRFAEADANHDGKLTPDETSDYFVTTIFDARDLNHDGQLTWQEWNVPGSGRSKAGFDAADKNKDGSVTLAEARAYGRKRGVYAEEFHKADSNHDGYVTREEAKAFQASTEGPPR